MGVNIVWKSQHAISFTCTPNNLSTKARATLQICRQDHLLFFINAHLHISTHPFFKLKYFLLYVQNVDFPQIQA